MIRNKSLGIWIIPLLMAGFVVAMKAAIGPYWLSPSNDPAYMYLVNSLYIADGLVPRFVEHPGTTVQMLGALIIKLYNLGLTDEAIVENVYRDPELYMNTIHYALMVLFFGSLVWLGVYAYRKTGDLLAAMLMQLPSLFYLTTQSYGTDRYVLPVIVNIDAEPFLAVVTNLFLICFLKLYTENEQKPSLVIVFAVVCGLGLATKVTFVPMVLVPFLLFKQKKEKLIFVAATVLSFLVFTAVIIPHYHFTFKWLKNLLIYKEHGAGELGFDPGNYVHGFIRIIRENLVLTTLVVIGTVLLLAGRKKWEGEKRKTAGALAAILMAVSGFYVLFAQHPAPHYMVPATGLIGAMVFLVCRLTGMDDQGKKRKIFWAFLSLMVICRAGMAAHYYTEARAFHQEIYQFSRMVYSKYENCMICPYYRSSSPAYALDFGDDNAGRLEYKKVLRKVYPEVYYFHYWSRRFHDGLVDIPFAELKRVNDCILLYGIKYKHDFQEGYWIVEKIESSREEDVFRVHASVADMAIENLQISRFFFERGDYKKAYEYAVKSRSLGMPNIDPYLRQLEFLMKVNPQ